ncbi:unnamed protein product [Cylindrotheca closterium]|uniref:Uncharacterized protein n=1 Tax=Cylindrotheca closterium TaxID=2856 RepID=A0AAD2GA14_9STRA|nr:unnamed protein product [Cylindrotheca closterium]
MQIEHLKETISKQQDEIHQTEKEVQQAHQETQKYQAQAKTSQNKHEALAMQLHNLQVVVQETKKSSQLLLDQQDELTHMARSMEEQYFQTQATNMQQQRQHSHLQQEHQALLQDKEKLQNRVKHLQNDLKAKERQIQQHWQQSVKTLEQKQVWNVQRIEALEDELQESKTLTLQALTTTQKSEATSQQLQTELATLQSTLDECQQEYKSQQEQLQAQLDESRQKCQSKEHSNQKLVAQMKQVQHQGQDFRLELQAMEQILKEQHKRRNKGGSTTSIISPATNSNTTTNQQQVLCAEKCRACQLPYALGLPQHYATISSPTNHHPNAAKTNTKTITPTTAALTKAATFRLVQSTSATTTTTTSPLYVCLHCVQAIAQPILASTSSKRKNGGKSSSRGRKRRSAPGEKIDCMKKAVPVGSGIGNSDKQAVGPIPGGDDGTNNSRKKHCFMTEAAESMVSSTTTGTGTDAAKVATNGQEASLHLSPKTRLTSAVARMVGPPSSNQVISK